RSCRSKRGGLGSPMQSTSATAAPRTQSPPAPAAAAGRVLVPLRVDAPPSPPDGDMVLHRCGGRTMGTTWSVRCLIARDDVYDRDAVAIEAGIDALLAQIVAQMSNWL